ncbi:MAG: membrane protein insertion efficiency factor YidD [Pseudomonadota bacterium]
MSRWPARALAGLFRFYRYTLSSVLGRQCRYLPTCSQYGEEAVLRYGVWVGGWMTFARLCRCGPWGPSGYDPVPDLPPDAWKAPWRHACWTGRHMDPGTRLDL